MLLLKFDNNRLINSNFRTTTFLEIQYVICVFKKKKIKYKLNIDFRYFMLHLSL